MNPEDLMNPETLATMVEMGIAASTNVVLAAIILIIGLFIAGSVRKAIRTAVHKSATMDDTLGGFFGPALSRQNILRSTAAALAYALLDELTQGLPVLQRTVDPLDMAANAAGIVLVGLAMLLLARRLEPAPAADNP